jgi:hypothetical protein
MATNHLTHCDYDFCLNLDGIILEGEDRSPELLVSTRTLLREYASDRNLPSDPKDLSGNSAFLTGLIGGDARFFPYADLPVHGDSLDFVRVIPGGFSQDSPLSGPDAVAVFAIKGDWVFFTQWKLDNAGIEACDNLWNQEPPIPEDTEQRFLGCYAENIPKQSYYQKWVARAQAYVDRLAAAD